MSKSGSAQRRYMGSSTLCARVRVIGRDQHETDIPLLIMWQLNPCCTGVFWHGCCGVVQPHLLPGHPDGSGCSGAHTGTCFGEAGTNT